MDLIIGFPRILKQLDSIKAVVDMLSKVDHFIVVKSTNSTNEVAQIFIGDLVRLHGVPKNIISNRDANFTSKFWKDVSASSGIE